MSRFAAVLIPVIASGGMGSPDDGVKVVKESPMQSRWPMFCITTSTRYPKFVQRLLRTIFQFDTFSLMDRGQEKGNGDGRVSIIDYGTGNIKSLCSAIETTADFPKSVGVKAPSAPKKYCFPVLFKAGYEGLNRAGLRECLLEFVKSGRPLLGICLGMQLLFDESKENGVHPGLGILNGLVEAIPISDDDGGSRKRTHIGWNQIAQTEKSATWSGSVLDGIDESSTFYFVHSFAVKPSTNDLLATTDYDGIHPWRL